MSAARTRFLQLVESKLGAVVLWAGNGPDVFDCSGLVLWALAGAGAKLPDRRAQDLADETPNLLTERAGGLAAPQPGDLVFYGSDWAHVIHVAVWKGAGKVISADGATSHQKDLKTAQGTESARVRQHDSMNFRRDWLGLHRNTFVDALDTKPTS